MVSGSTALERLGVKNRVQTVRPSSVRFCHEKKVKQTSIRWEASSLPSTGACIIFVSHRALVPAASSRPLKHSIPNTVLLCATGRAGGLRRGNRPRECVCARCEDQEPRHALRRYPMRLPHPRSHGNRKGAFAAVDDLSTFYCTVSYNIIQPVFFHSKSP